MSLQPPLIARNSRTSSPRSSFQGNNERVEEILQSLISLPLENHHLVRIHLGCHFRDAIQTAAAHQPYHIVSIVKSAQVSAADQTVPADEKSLEARIFQAGGTRALVAFAAACQADREVHSLIKSLDKDDLGAFIKSTACIKAHPKFSLIVSKTDAAEPPEDKPTKHVPAPRNWKGRGTNAKGTPRNKDNAKGLVQRRKRKLVDDQAAQKMSKQRQSSREPSTHSDTIRDPTETIRGYTTQDDTGLFANSEPLRVTSTLGDGGGGSEAPRNHQSRTTKPAEAIEYRYQPLDFGSQGMHVMPRGVCEPKHAATEFR
ncbi:hypothetical protein BGZ61DRAFT_231024 [Ilyonectria robusta]|uniref:uncharacterized protein n=1 Tax=Ilyonectria robusta TaxID=1079257 RepID=UPI001E8E1F3F|nr:uncharacterized protein BGZ61DRAFT_231024 [Ilyonectria robusta]KAH8651705.1 hypothetical protein BGZ61DRAFT_231024 [Ilyonectria robusta]